MKGKTHDLNHDLTFSINCVCHSIRSMFRVLGMYNFGSALPRYPPCFIVFLFSSSIFNWHIRPSLFEICFKSTNCSYGGPWLALFQLARSLIYLDLEIVLNTSSLQTDLRSALLYKGPSNPTGKNFVTNVYCNYL